MERSAHSLTPVFHRLAIAGWQRPADSALRQEVGRIGREGEQRMMAATAGVNTHRGAIWAMGLLVTAVAMQGGNATPSSSCVLAAQLAQLPDHASPKVFSKGLRATQRYQVPGAREEAQQGFPHVMQRALPQLWHSRSQGASEPAAQIDALMAIMTTLSDTCVLSRGGLTALKAMQQGPPRYCMLEDINIRQGRRRWPNWNNGYWRATLHPVAQPICWLRLCSSNRATAR